MVNLIFLPHSFTGHKFDDCYRWSFKPITNSTATTWLKDGTDWTFFNNLIYDDCGMCHIELISTKPIIKSKLLLNVELSKTKLQLEQCDWMLYCSLKSVLHHWSLRNSKISLNQITEKFDLISFIVNCMNSTEMKPIDLLKESDLRLLKCNKTVSLRFS